MQRRTALVAAFVLTLTLAACSGDDDDSADSDSSSDTAAADEPGGDAGDASVEDVGTTTIAASESGDLRIESTSTRAALVSDGDVLVTVSGEAAADASVTRNGDDVTAAFSLAGGVMRGVVDDLDDGENVIEAAAGDHTVAITVTNHPKNGPVFSGPHLEPWVCTTEDHGLGAPLDDDCDAETKTTWSYVSTDGSTKDLADPAALADDIATTTIDDVEVPFVIRTEQGVIDRGVYWIWVLDPEPSVDHEWSASAWNERLVYRFGGGCGTSYSQGAPLGAGIDIDLIGRGYALATNTLDTFQSNCNATLSAEAALMTREHFIEDYGVPEFTIGDGGSGGAIQQLLIAHNYPGLLDGLSPSVPFPDAISISGGVSDCGLLQEYYGTEFGTALTDVQKVAINGHMTLGTCQMWVNLFLGAIEPFAGCDGSLADEVYDPETNPDGVRCTLADINVNVLGEDPDTGFAYRPLDNVGVQYGLDAVNAGTITVDQFLDLNEYVGGWDIDGNVVAERTEINEDVASIAYRVGGIIGEGPLQDVPIVMRNVYTDDVGDIHTRFHPFSIRDRLQVDGADNPNVVLWTTPAGGGDLIAALTGNIANANAPITLLDEWLTTGTKPAGAVNTCLLPDGETVEGGWEIYDEPGPCLDAYPLHEDPRLAAGQERREDIVKCELIPVDALSYEVTFTDEQAERLAAVFPDGVCDWTKPGVGQQPPASEWPLFGG